MPKVAITVWGSRISPVFESASRVRLIQVVQSRSTWLDDLSLPHDPMSRIALLGEHGVQVLICGAISGLQASIIRAWEIELIPFVTGDAQEVLAAYIQGELHAERFTLPGCFRRQRHRRRRGRR
ncbi:MAG: NifB/NifX family molybdenum-iron cluster-binding protein [Desulfovermiculus sp.]|nr:NifB/NifX family molybdenum-iron cluster-binding protein [Desulfovermiculus sp.]